MAAWPKAQVGAEGRSQMLVKTGPCPQVVLETVGEVKAIVGKEMQCQMCLRGARRAAWAVVGRVNEDLSPILPGAGETFQ